MSDVNRPRVSLVLDGVIIGLADAEVKLLRGALYDRLRNETVVMRLPQALPQQRGRARAVASRVRGLLRLLSGSLRPDEFLEYRRTEGHQFALSTPTVQESNE